MFLFLLLAFSCSGESQKDVRELRGQYIREGMTAYGEKNYEKAIDKLKKAFKLDTTSAPIAYNIACCYSLHNNVDSAIHWVNRTIELGSYSFSQDSDFDNIRESEEFIEATVRAESLLAVAREKEWPTFVFKPENYVDNKRYPVMIMLHGFGSAPQDFTGDFVDYIRDKGFIFVVPYGTEIYGLKSFGWGDSRKVDEKIFNDIRNLKEEYSIDTTGIILAGFSQGGSRTFSTVLRNPGIFMGGITIAGYYNAEELNKYIDNIEGGELKLYMMLGGKESDEMIASNREVKKLLEGKGVEVRLKIFPELGHAFPGNQEEEIKEAIDFIVED